MKNSTKKSDNAFRKNKNTIFQNLWNTAIVVLKGRFIVIQGYLKKPEKYQVNNLTYHLKQLEKKDEQNPKSAEGKKKKVRVVINKTWTKKLIENRETGLRWHNRWTEAQLLS